MKKTKNIFRLTAVGLAFYYTLAIAVRVGLIELSKWAVTQGEVPKWFFGWVITTNPETIQIFMTIFVISIFWDWRNPIQVIFDILVGWIVMFIWGKVSFPIPEAASGLLNSVTLSVLFTSVFAVLVETKIKFTAKGKEPVVSLDPYPDSDVDPDPDSDVDTDSDVG